MTDTEKNRKAGAIGNRYAVGTIVVVVVLMHVLLVGINFIPCRPCRNAPYFFVTGFKILPLTFSLGSLSLFAMAHVLGKLAGRKTIAEHQPYWWTGPITAFATLFVVTCITVLLSSFETDWRTRGLSMESFDNVLPVLLIVLWIGMSPAAFLGLIYGRLLKRRRRIWT
jgi:hypothetical protein